MKTGIELIAEERREQIEKHGRTIERDILYNRTRQLSSGAAMLIWSEDMLIALKSGGLAPWMGH